jgi:RNA-binding protein
MVNQKQKKQLKALAHHLSPVVQVGKEGVFDNVIKNTATALDSHQLIKVHVANTCSQTVNEVALELSVATKATIIQLIGRMIVLYTPSKDRREWLI